MNDLKGKIAVVTGASIGVGEQISLRLVKAGVQVINFKIYKLIKLSDWKYKHHNSVLLNNKQNLFFIIISKST